MLSFFKNKISLAMLFAVATTPAFATEQTASVAAGQWSANIGVVSKYVYRGSVENNDLAMQGGFGYTHRSGLFVEYWGSTLDYDASDENQTHGFENDFYLGYANEISENLSWSTKLATYLYHRGGSVYNAELTEKRRTTGTEWVTELDYQNLALSMAVSLSDVNYGNAGDVYLSAGYRYALAQDFAINTLLGMNVFNSHRDDSLIETRKSTVFNEARLGLSKSFADTGVDMTLDYIWGGQDRSNENLDDHLVFGLSYSF